MYNQFKLILIDEYGMELRTVLVDNEPQVAEVDINNRFNLPPNQNIWTTGDVVYMQNKNNNTIPKATLVYPLDNSILYNLSAVTFQANAVNGNIKIQKISFYVNGNLVHQDFSYPIATNRNGLTSSIDMAAFSIQNTTTTLSNSSKISTSTDDAEEYNNGHMDLLNWDIDLGYNDYTCGFRFQNVNIPPDATVTDAYIQFTADETKSNPTSLTIFGERNANAKTFFANYDDISSRAKTNNSVDWIVNFWERGESGLAQRTPNLKNILNEIIAFPGYKLESPFVFVVEGSGYRAAETVDSDSVKAAVLHYSYNLPNHLIDILPGDTDNNGIVESKDILYNCLSFNQSGLTRSNATIEWIPQPVTPWNSFIGGVNFAHQDADGNGLINKKDINAVVFNYGEGNPTYNSFIANQTEALKLKESYSNSSEVKKYVLFLDAESSVTAHGINGSIDLSEFIKSDVDIVEIDTNLYEFNVAFAKYHKDTKILDFAFSRTDQQDKFIGSYSWNLIDNVFLSITIDKEDLIESEQVKKASIKSNIISANGNYESLNGSNFYVYQVQTAALETVNFNLISIDSYCQQKGAAEIQIYEDDLSTYKFEWSNGMSGNQVDSLSAGNYTLSIKKDGNIIQTIDFEIASISGVSEMLIIDRDITKNSIFKVSKEILIESDVEIAKDYDVEFLIGGCE